MDFDKHAERIVKTIFLHFSITSQETFKESEEEVYELLEQFAHELPTYVADLAESLPKANLIDSEDYFED